MDARPGGPATKREPSPEGLAPNREDDPSTVGAALNLGHARIFVIRSELRVRLHPSTATDLSWKCFFDRSVLDPQRIGEPVQEKGAYGAYGAFSADILATVP